MSVPGGDDNLSSITVPENWEIFRSESLKIFLFLVFLYFVFSSVFREENIFNHFILSIEKKLQTAGLSYLMHTLTKSHSISWKSNLSA